MRWIGAAVLGAVVLALVGLPRLLSGSDEPVGDRELIGPGGTTGEEGRARFAFLGEEARDGNLTFVVSGSDCTVNRIEGSVVRVPQGRFCVVSMTLRNDGRAPAEFSAARQALVDRQNRRYAADPLATLVHPANTDRNLIMLLVNPGNQAQVVLVFDVPPDADPDAIALRASDRGPGAFVRLRPPR